MQKHVKKVGKVTGFDHNDNSRVIRILTEAQETTGHARFWQVVSYCLPDIPEEKTRMQEGSVAGTGDHR